MQDLHWPLTVLSKAVSFKNLTGASASLGISQPQLSRLIKKIEEELDIQLLDRTSKRASQWLPVAHELATLYRLADNRLKNSIDELKKDGNPTHCRIGTLEGLAAVAADYAHALFEHTSIHFIQADVFELTDLVARFQAGELDIIFTSDVPKTYTGNYTLKLGYQDFSKINSDKDLAVYSPYEWQLRPEKTRSPQTLVSNSLYLRRYWLENLGGKGQFPHEINKNKGAKNRAPVFMIAKSNINPKIWEALVASKP